MPGAGLSQLRPYFDGRWYAATYGASTWRVRRNPWRYYRRRGRWKLHSPRPLFAAAWYLARNPDVQDSGLDPLAHYVTRGWHEGRRPHPLFEPAWYLASHPDVQAAGIEPLLHYVTHGWREGRSPHPAFDAPAYLTAHPDVAAAQVDPLGHYLEHGWRLGCRPHPLFDPRWYLDCHADVAAADIEPLSHFLDTGWQEGRDPSPDLSLATYERTFGRPVAAGVELFVQAIPPGTGAAPTSDPPRIRPIICDAAPAISNGQGPENHGHVRALAFYLPRFHSLPEQDALAGESQVEWNNVCRARPMFTGHRQPRVPASDLGYYDLDDLTVLERQADMARRHGIHGFCFHHTWFEGRRLLNRLVEAVLAGGVPQFPFCLCWGPGDPAPARHGLPGGPGLDGSPSSGPAERFIREVLPALRDQRYVTVEGRPLLVISSASRLQEPVATTDRWRSIAEREGMPGLHLVAFGMADRTDPRTLGFDSAVELPLLPTPVANLRCLGTRGLDPGFCGAVFDYREALVHALARPVAPYPLYHGVMAGADDTPRRLEQATVWINSSPECYGRWLRAIVERTQREQPPERQLVFLNAWNDWAGGAYLEPDCLLGDRYLQETAASLRPRTTSGSAAAVGPERQPARVPAIGRAA